MSKLFVLFASFMTCTFLSCGSKSQSAQDSTKLVPLLEIIGGDTFDAGEITRGDPLAHEFKVLNTGTKTLLLGRVTKSCSCLDAQIAPCILEPAQSATITVKADTNRMPGVAGAQIEVFDDSVNPPRSAAKLTVRARIRFDWTAALDPKFVRIGTVDDTVGVRVRTSLKVYLDPRETVDALQLIPDVERSDLSIRLDLEKATRSQDIVKMEDGTDMPCVKILTVPVELELQVATKSGVLSESIAMRVIRPSGQQVVNLGLLGVVETSIRVEPDHLLLEAESESDKPALFKIVARSPSDLETIKCESEDRLLAFRSKDVDPTTLHVEVRLVDNTKLIPRVSDVWITRKGVRVISIPVVVRPHR